MHYGCCAAAGLLKESVEAGADFANLLQVLQVNTAELPIFHKLKYWLFNR